jgi:hypothetical protein
MMSVEPELRVLLCRQQEKIQTGENAMKVALSSPKGFDGEGHDPKQLVARLKSPTPKTPKDAWRRQIEVCDPLLAKRLDEQREKASPGRVRRVYSKPSEKPAELPESASHAFVAAAPAGCECDAAEERVEQFQPAGEEEHPELAEEHPEQAEHLRPDQRAAVAPAAVRRDLSRSVLSLPSAACAVVVVAAVAGLAMVLLK